MKHRYIWLALCLTLAGFRPVAVHAQDLTAPAGHLVILAVQTGQVGATGNDFVEVYNPNASAADVTGWKLQYRAASSTGTATWSSKRVVACVPAATGCAVSLLAHGHLLFSTYDLPGVDGEQTMSSGLSDVGGQLRLVQPSGVDLIIHDVLGYGTAAEAEGGQAAAAPVAGETLVRNSVGAEVSDTNNNAADFSILAVGCYGLGGTPDLAVNNLCVVAPTDPVPVDDTPPVEEPPVEPPAPEPVPDPQPQPDPIVVPPPDPLPVDTPPVTDPTPTPIPDPVPPTPAPAPVVDPPVEPPTPTDPPVVTPPVYLPLEITELLPDPASPATDDADEYIELYNPGSEPVNTDGYALETGLNFTYHLTLSGITIPAGGYVVLMSAQTNLVLGNTAGAARLLDPSGAVIDTTGAYSQAKVGQTWAKIDGLWQWTSVVTPALANVADPLPPTPPNQVDVPPAEEPPLPVDTNPPVVDNPPATDTSNTSEDPAPVSPTVYPPILITELLPNPANPAQDSSDEFIELFNPNNTPVNLAGYTLETGSDFRYKFVITNRSIAAGGFVVINSATSHLTLGNSGSAVRLVDPNGQVVGLPINYDTAKDGQAWARMADGWHWTTTPTPGSANKLSSPPIKVAVAKVKKFTKAKAKTTKASSKVAAAMTSSTGPGTASVPVAQDKSGLNYIFVGAVAVAVLGYVVYEYRQNVARFGRKIWVAVTGKN